MGFLKEFIIFTVPTAILVGATVYSLYEGACRLISGGPYTFCPTEYYGIVTAVGASSVVLAEDIRKHFSYNARIPRVGIRLENLENKIEIIEYQLNKEEIESTEINVYKQ